MQMAALIELVCAAHAGAGADGPVVTTVEGLWAYCFGGTASDHDWRKIVPTPLAWLRAGMQTPTPQPAK
jgi:hypothetical protein